VEDLIEAYEKGVTHPTSLQKKLGWTLPTKKIGSKIAHLVKDGRISRAPREYECRPFQFANTFSALTATQLQLELTGERAASIVSSALSSIVIPESAPVPPTPSPSSSPVAVVPRIVPLKRHFSVKDPFEPFWVFEDDLLVAIWYLRLPTTTNLVTASDYSVTISWEIPSPSEDVFVRSRLPMSVFYLDLSPKSGVFRIETSGQIQQDQGKWRRETIDGGWIYLEIPKMTSLSEKSFAF
jgi:hypothetical protein